MKTLFGVLVFVCLETFSAAAQSRLEAESKVLALERLWGEAAQLRDIRALESIFDDSIIYVHIDGRLMTKDQVLADTRAVTAVEIVVDSSVARSHGNVVVVTGVLHLRGVEAGKPYLRYGRYLDTWLLRGNRWVCVSSMTTPMTR
jgi:ketosteroid isomerase-like protein